MRRRTTASILLAFLLTPFLREDMHAAVVVVDAKSIIERGDDGAAYRLVKPLAEQWNAPRRTASAVGMPRPR